MREAFFIFKQNLNVCIYSLLLAARMYGLDFWGHLVCFASIQDKIPLNWQILKVPLLITPSELKNCSDP